MKWPKTLLYITVVVIGIVFARVAVQQAIVRCATKNFLPRNRSDLTQPGRNVSIFRFSANPPATPDGRRATSSRWKFRRHHVVHFIYRQVTHIYIICIYINEYVSCEIEDFVESHLFKLRGIRRSRVLLVRVSCILYTKYIKVKARTGGKGRRL